MAKYMVIQREHEAQDIKSVMELPLTVQQQLSMKTGTLDDVHSFIDEHNLLDEDVFVVPFVSKLSCTIGKYKNAIIKSDLGIEVDNASNSIQIANRVFTFVDVTKSSDGMVHLHFFELVKDENSVGYTPDINETLTIVIDESNTKIKEIRRCEILVYADYLEEQLEKRGK